MNGFFKKFIICVCIVGLLFGTLRPNRASAIVGVDDCVLIGGVLIATSVVVSLMIKSGNYDGYEVKSDYSFDLRNYLTKKILALSSAEIAEYFFTAKDDSGNDYVGVTDSGTTYSREELKSLFNIEVNNFPVSTTKTTDNVTPVSKEPYMLNGFYMQSYDYGSSKTYVSFSAPPNNTVKFQFANATGDFVRTVTTSTRTNTLYFRVYQDESNTIDAFSSTTGSSWNGLFMNEHSSWGFPFSSGIVFIGVQSTSNTVYVPGNQVVTQSIPIDKPVDSVVAAPISGQYSDDGTTIVYNGIDGGVANAVSGLKAADLSTTTPIDGNTGSGTDAGFWSTLWGWLEKIYKGIISIPEVLEGLPADIAAAIGSLLQSLFVPSDTFFQDQFDKMKQPILNKFPNNLDVLKSLEVEGDDFNDIWVTTRFGSGVIVSASFVRQNISFIRGATSCLWLFLLVMYLWRKINSFVNGNEVIQPTVYSGRGGGGSHP